MTSYNPIFVADAELGTAKPQLVIIYPLFMFLQILIQNVREGGMSKDDLITGRKGWV